MLVILTLASFSHGSVLRSLFVALDSEGLNREVWSMSIEKTDNELIVELKKGNQGSFEELISRYSNKAFSLAARLTRNAQDAEEVLQDVFVTVYRNIDGFEGKSSFSSW